MFESSVTSNGSLALVVRPKSKNYTDFQRRFLYIPFHVFVNWTNIRDIITDRFVQRNNHEPSSIALDRILHNTHENLHSTNWNEMGLDKLSFISQEPNDTEASIFKDENSEIAHETLEDWMKQFAYLPLSILKATTNIEDIAKINRRIKFPNKTDAVIPQMVRSIHKALNRAEIGNSPKTNLTQMRFLGTFPSDAQRLFSLPQPTTEKPAESSTLSARQEAEAIATEKINKVLEDRGARAQKRKPDDSTKPGPKSVKEKAKRQRLERERLVKSSSNVDHENISDLVSIDLTNQPQPSTSKVQTRLSNSNSSSRISIDSDDSTKPGPKSMKEKAKRRRLERERLESRTECPHHVRKEEINNAIQCDVMRPPIAGEDLSISMETCNLSSNTNEQSQKDNKTEHHSNRTEFQDAILQLTKNEFIAQTNIEELIVDEIKKKNGADGVVTEAQKQKGYDYYFGKLTKTEYWYRSLLNGLKFKEIDQQVEASSSVQTGDQSVQTDDVTEMNEATVENVLDTGSSTCNLQLISEPNVDLNHEPQLDETAATAGHTVEPTPSNDCDEEILIQSIAFHTDSDENILPAGGIPSPIIADRPEPETNQEISTIEYHEGDDSDVILVESVTESPILVDDSIDVIESLMGANTETENEPSTNNTDSMNGAPHMTCDELVNILTGSENVSSAISDQITEDVPEMQRLQLRSVENIIDQAPSTSAMPAKRNTEMKKSKTNQKSKVSNDDTLSTIQPPRYTYQPLELITRQTNREVSSSETEAVEHDVSAIPQIENYADTQPSSTSQNMIIEEFDSAEEQQMEADPSPIENHPSRLLNEENSLFLNVDTQPNVMNALQIYSSHPIPISITERAVNNHPVNNDDQFEFLHEINIESVNSKIIFEAGERKLEFNMKLIFQCNGGTHITVNGESPMRILDLQQKELKAVERILFAIGRFECHLHRNNQPPHESILHRILYYLFKTTSHFSNIHVTYDDQDFDTARILSKPYVANSLDLSDTVDGNTLSMIKRKRATSRFK